jgi:CHAT domain-containing protein/Flp pilus assembly protein TadD
MASRHLLSLRIFFVLAIILHLSNLNAEQPTGSTQQLIDSVLELKSDQEQTEFLSKNKELITSNLRKELSAKADQLRLQGEYIEALNAYSVVQKIATELDDKIALAETFNNIGEVNRLLGKNEIAIDHYQQALTLSEQTGNKIGMINAWISFGKMGFQQGNYQEALDYQEKSLVLGKSIGYKLGMARAMNDKGVVLDALGDLATALESFKTSITLYDEVGNKASTAIPMNNMARIFALQADYDSAKIYLEKTLTLFDEAGQKTNVASVTLNIGNLYVDQGNYRIGLQNYLKALAIFQEVGCQHGVLDALINIAEIYQLQGNYDLALENYEEVLKGCEKIGAKVKAAIVMNNIGSIHNLKGNFEVAIRFLNDGLNISAEIGDLEGKATILTELGKAHSSSKKHSQALDFYQSALTIYEEQGNAEMIAKVTSLMAAQNQMRGDSKSAIQFAERSYTSASRVPNLEWIWQAKNILGNAYFASGDFSNAQKAFDEAIDAIEKLRFQVAGAEQETQRFFELRTAPYYAMVKLLVTQNKINDALIYAERAKARVTLDVLQSGKININKAMTIEEREKEKRINLELASFNKQIYTENLNENPDPKRLFELKSKLEKLRLTQDEFRAALYAAHPGLRTQRGEMPTMTTERLSQLLTVPSSVLMEFVVTDEKTYLFVLNKDASQSGSDPSADLHVYTLAESRQSLADRVEKFRNMLASRLGFQDASKELFKILLKPALEDFKDKKEIFIVPDGALWHLPFYALLNNRDRYLIEDHAISFVPSLSVMHIVVNQKKELNKDIPKTLLAFGNPALGSKQINQMKENYRDEKLDPLPEAEREVKQIAQLYSDSKVFVGADAGEDKLKLESGSYDILHLATHGIFSDTSPMYSHLVLAQTTDVKDEDGLVEAWEIMNMNLKADIAVLSACETARGRVGVGEGLIGLTWAFFVAGCPTAVVSQWAVDSASTSELMVAFHENLKKTDYNPAKALQLAALKLIKSENYRHPFYWAPFVVITSK